MAFLANNNIGLKIMNYLEPFTTHRWSNGWYRIQSLPKPVAAVVAVGSPPNPNPVEDAVAGAPKLNVEGAVETVGLPKPRDVVPPVPNPPKPSVGAVVAVVLAPNPPVALPKLKAGVADAVVVVRFEPKPNDAVVETGAVWGLAPNALDPKPNAELVVVAVFPNPKPMSMEAQYKEICEGCNVL